MEPKTRVVFRNFRDTGSLIALFPREIVDHDGNCSSYMHMGQHGPANYDHCIKITKAAVDYKNLQNELKSIGYNLDVKMRK